MSSLQNRFLHGASMRSSISPFAVSTRCSALPSRVPLQITAKYRGLNTDLRKVAAFQLHETDTGSAQVQVARFTARVTQLTQHLKSNKHDYASTRGLQLILGKRRRLLQYLYNNDRESFTRLLKELKIRYPMPKSRIR